MTFGQFKFFLDNFCDMLKKKKKKARNPDSYDAVTKIKIREIMVDNVSSNINIQTIFAITVFTLNVL